MFTPRPIRPVLALALLCSGCFISQEAQDERIDPDGDGVPSYLDCAPNDPTIGEADIPYFTDDDGDGFGDPSSPVLVCQGEVPTGAVENDEDCDDSTAERAPGNVEDPCSDRDEDCLPNDLPGVPFIIDGRPLTFTSFADAVANLNGGDTLSACFDEEVQLSAPLVIDQAVTINAFSTTAARAALVGAPGSSGSVIRIDAGSGDVALSGLHVSGGKGTSCPPITVSIFDLPAQPSCGGAIYVESVGTLTLTEVSLSESTATLGGGLFNAEGTKVQLVDSTISNNVAVVSGGGVFADGELEAQGTEISGNDAVGSEALQVIGVGGGITKLGGDLVLDADTTVFDSSAVVGGGVALFDANLVGGSIHNNAVPGDIVSDASNAGGIILVRTVAGDLSIRDAEVYENTALRSGGGLAVFSIVPGVVALTNLSFERNHAGSYGGAVLLNGTGATITNTTFLSNDTLLSVPDIVGVGGALALLCSSAECGDLEITDSTFTSNKASKSGGAIYLEDTKANDKTVDLFLTDTALASNRAGLSVNSTQGQGGAIFWYGRTLNVTGGSFANNEASGTPSAPTTAGGAIYVGTGHLSLGATGAPTSMTSNRTDGSGAAVYLASSINDYTQLSARGTDLIAAAINGNISGSSHGAVAIFGGTLSGTADVTGTMTNPSYDLEHTTAQGHFPETAFSCTPAACIPPLFVP